MTLSRNPAICAAELDGEICLFHPDNAEYLNFKATGPMLARGRSWNAMGLAELERTDSQTGNSLKPLQLQPGQADAIRGAKIIK